MIGAIPPARFVLIKLDQSKRKNLHERCQPAKQKEARATLWSQVAIQGRSGGANVLIVASVGRLHLELARIAARARAGERAAGGRGVLRTVGAELTENSVRAILASRLRVLTGTALFEQRIASRIRQPAKSGHSFH